MATKGKTPGSITKTADAMDDRINNISNVSKAINNMQRDVDQKIGETRDEVVKGSEVDAIHSSMNETMTQLNSTIGALSSGIRTITVDTAKATKDAIQSYGRAISEDISFNKKSVVAMALARTSPIYGYFVAKFVESDVWKRAMSRMAQSVSRTMGAIVRPFKGGRQKMQGGIPQLKNGGYIQQGGMAKLHQGETVTPSGGGPAMQQLLEVQQKQLIYLRSVFGVVRYKEPGMWGRFVNTMGAPLRFVNKFRKSVGVYSSSLSSSKQPLVNIAQNIATLYSSLMWRLDNMTNIMVANAVANRDLAMHTIGKGYPAIRGVRTRQLVRPRARRLLRLGMKALPYATGLLGAGMGGLGGAGLLGAGIGARMLTRKVKDISLRRQEEMGKGKRKGLGVLGHLGLERGLYRGTDEEGFISSKLRGLRQSWLPKKSEIIGRRGGMAGTGIGGGTTRMTLMNTSPGELAGMIGVGVRKALSGRKGRRDPIWTLRIPSSEQKRAWKEIKSSDKKQTKALKNITENTKESSSTIGDFFKKFKRWTFLNRLFRLGGGLISGLFSGLMSMLKIFTSPGGIMKYILGAAGLLGVGYSIGNWLDEHLFKDAREKFNDFVKQINEEIIARAQERRVSNAQLIADRNAPVTDRLRAAAIEERTKAIEGAPGFREKRDASITGGFTRKMLTSTDNWVESVNAGQAKYMQENSSKYLQYSVAEINRLRRKFVETGKFRPMSMHEAWDGSKGGDRYGRAREEAFLKYLQDQGTKLGQGEYGSHTERAIVEDMKRRGEKYTMPKREALTPADKLRNARNALEIHIGESYGLNTTRASTIANSIFKAALKSSVPATYWMDPANLISFGRSMMSAMDKSSPERKQYMREKMEKKDLDKFFSQQSEPILSDINSRGISKDSLVSSHATQEAAKNTAGVKDNTDAIKHNTMALKQDGKETRANQKVVSVNQTNQLVQSHSSTSSTSGGGGLPPNYHWSRRNLDEAAIY